MKRILIALCLLMATLTTACQTVTMVKDQQSKTAEDPSWQDSQSFFFWGLVGEKHIYTDRICNGQKPAMVVVQTTFLDGFLGAITLGIYSPRSVKVWCRGGETS